MPEPIASIQQASEGIGPRTRSHVRHRVGAMLRPPPQLTVSEWADQHRMLGSRGSAEPGPWPTSRTPYLKDVMDALSAVHPARRVVFMKGAQVGATESGNCWLGYIMHHVPAPVLAVQPTVELAKRFSRQRIDPLLEETPALRERVAPARARDSGNTMLSKEFPGGILVLAGANSAVGLRSMPARFLFLDEGEGDPIALAEAPSISPASAALIERRRERSGASSKRGTKTSHTTTCRRQYHPRTKLELAGYSTRRKTGIDDALPTRRHLLFTSKRRSNRL